MRILLVSQMYPGPDCPEFGSFVQSLERELLSRGHEIRRSVLTRRRSRTRFAKLLLDTRRQAKRFYHDVIYAHFLCPAGVIAGMSSGAPLVVTSHGQDVANIDWDRPLGRAFGHATKWVVERATTIITVSDFLQRELHHKVPSSIGKTEVINCGVDLNRFSVTQPPDGAPRFVCVGSLSERKNVIRLAEAFAPLAARGWTLEFVGDGELRPELVGRVGIELVGSVPHDLVADHLAQAHVVCQPSNREPFGLGALEGMASGRAVVGTLAGGHCEFIPTPEAGILVDPNDVLAIRDALIAAAEMPCPNEAARLAAERHDIRVQATRIEAVLEHAVDEARTR